MMNVCVCVWDPYANDYYPCLILISRHAMRIDVYPVQICCICMSPSCASDVVACWCSTFNAALTFFNFPGNDTTCTLCVYYQSLTRKGHLAASSISRRGYATRTAHHQKKAKHHQVPRVILTNVSTSTGPVAARRWENNKDNVPQIL